MIVKLRQLHPDYPDLSLNQLYAVIGIEADDLRILNDQGCPYLYPSSLFETIDYQEPMDWIKMKGEGGEQYAYPPELDAIGFFEDYFDGDEHAIAAFWRVVNQRLALAEKI
jgi:hypothetical protein